jgi:Spy/CpxP family protein refolding chaperone
MGMMGMARDPVHQSVFTAFALPEMQTELGLSAQQAAQLRQYKQELLTKGQELATQILAKQKELDGLVGAGSSKNAEVKQLLEQVASLRAQLEFAAFETAGKMKDALTDPQRSKLAAMGPFELHQVMMARMTVAEMTQMMQFMGGDGGMMRRGMMGMMGMGAAPRQ